MSRTGGDLVYDALVALGVEHVFGIVSVHNIAIYDAILRGADVQPIDSRPEQGAVHAADGYARASGRLGVAITSTGPGACNAVAGLYEAGFASSPVLMITGQVDSPFYGKTKGVLHEAEGQLDMLRAVTCRAEHVDDTDDIANVIFRVAREVTEGRPQPGAVEIPVDFQYAQTAAIVGTPDRAKPAAGPSAVIREAADLIAEHDRRVIWAGGGVITADAGDELAALAESLDAPVFTTSSGRGSLPEDHRLAMGPLTVQPEMQETLNNAQVVIAVGTRFQGGSTNNWALELPGKLIHIDADETVIGRNYPADVQIVGDARMSLVALRQALNVEPGDPDFLAAAQGARDATRDGIREQMGPDHQRIMNCIRDTLPRAGRVVRDATVPAYIWGNRLLPILEPRTSLNSTSSAIGPGLALAIGAAVATGEKTVVIQGDGGFQLSIGELATAAQYNLPIVICVFNDGGYGVLRFIQRMRFEGRITGVDLKTPDFAQVANGMGVTGVRVEGIDAFESEFKKAIDADGPVVLDIDMSALEPMGSLFGPPRQR